MVIYPPPPNPSEAPRLRPHVSVPLCENVSVTMERLTPTHTKETNTTGYILMIYTVRKSICVCCVLVWLPTGQLLSSWADKDKKHIWFIFHGLSIRSLLFFATLGRAETATAELCVAVEAAVFHWQHYFSFFLNLRLECFEHIMNIFNSVWAGQGLCLFASGDRGWGWLERSVIRQPVVSFFYWSAVGRESKHSLLHKTHNTHSWHVQLQTERYT